MSGHTRELLQEMVGDTACFLDPKTFDVAILGICERADGMSVVAYDRSSVIDVLSRDMSREDAEEWFEFNIARAWMGKDSPVFIDMRPCE